MLLRLIMALAIVRRLPFTVRLIVPWTLVVRVFHMCLAARALAQIHRLMTLQRHRNPPIHRDQPVRIHVPKPHVLLRRVHEQRIRTSVEPHRLLPHVAQIDVRLRERQRRRAARRPVLPGRASGLVDVPVQVHEGPDARDGGEELAVADGLAGGAVVDAEGWAVRDDEVRALVGRRGDVCRAAGGVKAPLGRGVVGKAVVGEERGVRRDKCLTAVQAWKSATARMEDDGSIDEEDLP